jgi:hypothetical protein
VEFLQECKHLLLARSAVQLVNTPALSFVALFPLLSSAFLGELRRQLFHLMQRQQHNDLLRLAPMQEVRWGSVMQVRVTRRGSPGCLVRVNLVMTSCFRS